MHFESCILFPCTSILFIAGGDCSQAGGRGGHFDPTLADQSQLLTLSIAPAIIVAVNIIESSEIVVTNSFYMLSV